MDGPTPVSIWEVQFVLDGLFKKKKTWHWEIWWEDRKERDSGGDGENCREKYSQNTLYEILN